MSPRSSMASNIVSSSMREIRSDRNSEALKLQPHALAILYAGRQREVPTQAVVRKRLSLYASRIIQMDFVITPRPPCANSCEVIRGGRPGGQKCALHRIPKVAPLLTSSHAKVSGNYLTQRARVRARDKVVNRFLREMCPSVLDGFRMNPIAPGDILRRRPSARRVSRSTSA